MNYIATFTLYPFEDRWILYSIVNDKDEVLEFDFIDNICITSVNLEMIEVVIDNTSEEMEIEYKPNLCEWNRLLSLKESLA
jgi:transposase